jgi:hypothetical protein
VVKQRYSGYADRILIALGQMAVNGATPSLPRDPATIRSPSAERLAEVERAAAFVAVRSDVPRSCFRRDRPCA